METTYEVETLDEAVKVNRGAGTLSGLERCRVCFKLHRHYIYIGITWHHGVKFRIKRCSMCGGEWEEEA